jgi:diguanylate cyclase (GGDEF)-like protein
VYAAAGALTAFAAPAGLLGVRLASGSTGSIAREIAGDHLTYAAVFVASAAAGATFGYWVGSHADHLQTLAATDPLTRLPNRRAIEGQLQREHVSAARYGVPLSVLLIDVDGLKRVNDQGGHAAGDRLLRNTAAAIRQTLRGSDYGGRWGGDEFLILAPHTAGDAARRRIARRMSSTRTVRATATASIGVATFEPELPVEAAPLALIEEADRALYEAKKAGRGRVCASRSAGRAACSNERSIRPQGASESRNRG